jgi:hypothetical protein
VAVRIRFGPASPEQDLELKKDYRRRSVGIYSRLALAFGLALFSALGAASATKQKPITTVVNKPVEWDKLLVKGEPTPIIRFAVAHQHAASGCIGYLYITRGEIEYVVKKPASDSDHSFHFARSLLTVARQWKVMGSAMPELELKFSNGKTYHFFRVRESLITEPTLDPGKLKWEDVRSWEPMLQAIQHFDETVQMAEKRQEELHPKPAPTVTLNVEPGTIEKGHSVILTWKSENATKLDLQPDIGPVPGTGTRTVSPTESTTYVLTARGPGGSNAATGRVTVNAPASPPTVILVDPSVSAPGQTIQVKNSPLSIRGVAMDDSGIPAVTINGAPASMRPKSSQAAEFTSDPLALDPGENHVEIAATNAAHVQTKFAFNVNFTPPPPPKPKAEPKAAPPPNPKALSKADITDLLSGDVASARVAELVKQYGIKFSPTEDDIKEIRAVGGEDDLVLAIEHAAAAAAH